MVQRELEEAIAKVREVFPFRDYLDEAVCSELSAIVGPLRRYLLSFHKKRLIDFGCGPMDKTGVFQVLGFQCFGVDDLSDPWHRRDDNVSKIKKYAHEIGITFFHQDQDQMLVPFQEASFDVACALGVIEHLHESPRNFLNTVGTCLRPEGILILTTPNSVCLWKRLFVMAGRSNHVPIDMFFHSTGTWRGHVREYTLCEAVYICSMAGFRILYAGTFEYAAYRRLSTPLRQFYILFTRIIPRFRSGLLLLCMKPQFWTPLMHDPLMFRKTLARGVPRGVR
jgi:SAM-dependent methyltransferase